VKKKLKNASPLSYIDLLILTLTQHEKNLSLIIEKLERISDKLEDICVEFSKQKRKSKKGRRSPKFSKPL
jgi:uncharacterized protein with ParB-like and HNH nuclease domain